MLQDLASGKTKAMQSISQEKQTAPCSVLLRNFSKGEPSEQILAEADTQHLFKQPQSTAPSSTVCPVCGQAHPWAHSFDPTWAHKEAPARSQLQEPHLAMFKLLSNVKSFK